MEEQFNLFIIQAVIQFFGEQEPMDFVLKNLWEAGCVALESSLKFTCLFAHSQSFPILVNMEMLETELSWTWNFKLY